MLTVSKIDGNRPINNAWLLFARGVVKLYLQDDWLSSEEKRTYSRSMVKNLFAPSFTRIKKKWNSGSEDPSVGNIYEDGCF